MKATLLLSDKTRWEGEAFGSPGVAIGHITCHTGCYMKMMADPAYANQLVLLSTPLAGTCGINTEFCETGRPWLSGLIVQDCCESPSHWRSAETLDYYLRRHYVTAIKGVDTRALLAHVAAKGPFRAAICATPDFNGWEALLAKLNGHTMHSPYPGAVKAPTRYAALGARRAGIGLVDLGSSLLLAQQLGKSGFEVTLLPPSGDWVMHGFDALVLSHGAREDCHDERLVARVRDIIDNGKPLLAVGNGFSLLCAALDRPLTPTALGYYTDAFPVTHIETGRTTPTVHSHRLRLAHSDAAHDARLTETHLTADGDCCVGFTLTDRPVWAMQFTDFDALPPAFLHAAVTKGTARHA